jgi:Circularly permutated YpsA SLOG family
VNGDGRASPVRVEKIVSGGQTGVDRAALDVALGMGLDCGGWCPRGRRAEDGPIPSRYPLEETTSANYSQRTKRNVRDSDGTLILCSGPPRGGTLLTQQTAVKRGKPCLLVDLEASTAVDTIRAWLGEHSIRVLNVAGPRESQAPGIALRVARVLHECLTSPPPLPSMASETRG